MAAVKITRPENRLAKVMEGYEGATFGELVAASERRLDTLSKDLRAYVLQQSAEIIGFGGESEDGLFERCKALGDTAMNVAEVAGAAGLDAIGEVARGIRAMVDSLAVAGVWHTDGLKVHIAALAILIGKPATPGKEIALMLGQLHAMRKSLGVVE